MILIDFSVHLYQIYNILNMDLTPVTYEQVLILFAATSKQLAETDKQLTETGEYIKSISKKADARQKKMDKQFAETGEYIKSITAKTDARQKETNAQLKLLAKQVAEVTDSIGRFAEEQVRPRILAMFRAKGIELEETHPRVRVEKNGKFLLEIDLLLVNTIYSVVVEVKNTLRQRDVDEHIERLKKLQETPSRSIKGTTMYGAVAGMIVTDEVEKYAIKKGLYVIKPKGDSVEISNRDNFKPKTWEIKA